MGRTSKDDTKRVRKLELRHEKTLARVLASKENPDARSDDDASESGFLDVPSARSSRKTSRVASSAASRNASPFPVDRISSNLEDLSLLSALRRPNGSALSSRAASRLHSPEESDLELDPSAALDLLDGDELLQKMTEILSSKTSARGAEHKKKKASGRSSKRGRHEGKNTSSEVSRKEQVLSRLCEFLRGNVFIANVEDEQIQNMHRSILLSIKQPGSPKEKDMALRAFAMVAVTSGADESFMASISILREIVMNDPSFETKALAIYALTAVICFGDSGSEQRDKLLEYLLDIIRNNGDSINAPDNATVVGAAMESWAFVAPECELHSHSVDAMEAYIEQLESTETQIQVLAASNIALMFDISRQLHQEAVDEAESNQAPDTSKMLELYEDPNRLAQKIRQITKEQISARTRQNRAEWKTQIAYAADSLELDVGFGYSTVAQESYYLGYSECLKVNHRKIVIKSWAIWSRIRFLKSILGGGFANHFDENDKVGYFLRDAEILGLMQDWDHEPKESPDCWKGHTKALQDEPGSPT